MSDENLLIKCKCGKRFPLNPSKHTHDKVVYCPFCHRDHKNPKHGLINWPINKAYWDEKSEKMKEFFRLEELSSITGISIRKLKKGWKPPDEA